ncbi:superinfection exclusion protein [Erwinia phage phiEa2809]|uniref:Superinfection exclusion protein n=1 Tax=Erwinia phage phiEa2809 TaxID=1564096 RepID=A0A0A0YR69_9CAUD|nr:superinfection exclusion [Erwinia phage phiEa2809]AIX13087.1 superinfection exclusion protein [Erwinia phage phiEa2809]
MTEVTKFQLQFRVWHVPQVPGKAFTFEVPTYDEAVRLQNALAGYDIFQFENNIKPDYCNASGIHFFDHTLSDSDLEEMNLSDRWISIENAQDLAGYMEDFRSNGFHGYHKLPGDAMDAGVEAVRFTVGNIDEQMAERMVQRVHDAVRLALNAEQDKI